MDNPGYDRILSGRGVQQPNIVVCNVRPDCYQCVVDVVALLTGIHAEIGRATFAQPGTQRITDALLITEDNPIPRWRDFKARFACSLPSAPLSLVEPVSH